MGSEATGRDKWESWEGRRWKRRQTSTWEEECVFKDLIVFWTATCRPLEQISSTPLRWSPPSSPAASALSSQLGKLYQTWQFASFRRIWQTLGSSFSKKQLLNENFCWVSFFLPASLRILFLWSVCWRDEQSFSSPFSSSSCPAAARSVRTCTRCCSSQAKRSCSPRLGSCNKRSWPSSWKEEMQQRNWNSNSHRANTRRHGDMGLPLSPLHGNEIKWLLMKHLNNCCLKYWRLKGA